MINVYEQVSANKTRSFVIIGLFIAFIIAASYLITYSFNLGDTFFIYAILFSFVSSFVSYFWGDQIVLSLNSARPAKREEFFDFYTVAENLAMADGLPQPKLYVIDSDAPNAFATGRDPQHAIVCATTGLLSKLNRSQLEAVIAHELSHVKNYDIRLMMIVSVLVGSLSILTNLSSRSLFFGRGGDREDRNGSGILAIIGLILIIFAPLIAQLVQLAISRRREYLADASGVLLTRQPQSLIEALKIISQDKETLKTASTATASLYIANPFKGNKLASLFSTHPPIDDRIKALEQML